MAKQYRVTNHNERGDVTHTYPADAESLAIVMNAGGCSQLTTEQREKVKFKTVKAGDDCSDMPPNTLRIFLERGWVEEVDQPAPAGKSKTVKE